MMNSVVFAFALSFLPYDTPCKIFFKNDSVADQNFSVCIHKTFHQPENKQKLRKLMRVVSVCVDLCAMQCKKRVLQVGVVPTVSKQFTMGKESLIT